MEIFKINKNNKMSIIQIIILNRIKTQNNNKINKI